MTKAEPASDAVLVLLRVADVEAWRAQWGAEATLRRELGVAEASAGQALDEPSLVAVYVAPGAAAARLLQRSAALGPAAGWSVLERREQRHHHDPGPQVRAAYAAVVAQNVQDFERWYGVFGELEPLRRQAGVVGVRVSRAPADAQRVYLFAWFDDPERYAALVRSQQLRDRLSAAGVIGAPEVVRLRMLPDAP